MSFILNYSHYACNDKRDEKPLGKGLLSLEPAGQAECFGRS
jgi:hypothetical protein